MKKTIQMNNAHDHVRRIFPLGGEIWQKDVVLFRACDSLRLMRIFLFLNIFLLVGLVSALAQGSPPFLTDDAGTVEKNQWELDVGFSTERSQNGDCTSSAPSISLCYGLTDQFEIDYGVPLLVVRVEGESAQSGLGNSVAGVKWRFFEDRGAKFAVSVNPQVEFNNPTSSRRRGLVENSTEFLLPFQVQKSFGDFDTALNVGRTFHGRESSETDGWMAGVAAGRKISKHIHAGVELFGEAARKLDRGHLILNVGVIFEINDKVSLSASAGRGIAGADRPDFVGFIGVALIR